MEQKRDLVYWGAGSIGSLCLEMYPDIRPKFFIDSNWESGMFYDLPVKKPDNIVCWKELNIVITTTAYNEIEKILISKDLKKNENYRC